MRGLPNDRPQGIPAHVAHVGADTGLDQALNATCSRSRSCLLALCDR